MYAFADLAEVEACLASLMDGGLVLRLPRAPGAREARVAQLLGGPVDTAVPTPVPSAPSRLGELEQEVATLRNELAALRAEFESFKAQF